MDIKKNSAKIIDALGGATRLGNHMGKKTPTVHSWRKKGIPSYVQLKYPEIITAGTQAAEIIEGFYEFPCK